MNILLAVDDSIHSRSAIDAVLSRLWPDKTNFRIISVVEDSEAGKSKPSERTAGGRGATEQMVKAVAAQLEKRFPDANVRSEVLYGYSKEKILDYAAEWPADLVAMGSHGRRGLTRILLGSVSQTVLLYGQCSTLIVRLPQTQKGTNGFGSPRKVLIPLDLSRHSINALDWVKSLSWTPGCKFKILTVIPPMVEPFSDGLALLQGERLSQERVKAKEDAQRFLAECKSVLAERYGAERVNARLVEGDAGDTILKVARDWPADLVVMGTRGHGTLARLWLGSVSQVVVLQAPCPVEVVKTPLTVAG